MNLPKKAMIEIVLSWPFLSNYLFVILYLLKPEYHVYRSYRTA